MTHLHPSVVISPIATLLAVTAITTFLWLTARAFGRRPRLVSSLAAAALLWAFVLPFLLSGELLEPTCAAGPRNLDETLRGLASQPIEAVPFHKVIAAVTGHKIIPIERTTPAHRALLSGLTKAIEAAVEDAARKGLAARRPNEAGNRMEGVLKQSLQKLGLRAETPTTVSGRRQSVGYPDVYVEASADMSCYLEVKTYSARNADTTQRAFYYSPSVKNSKVTKELPHLLVGFEMERVSRDGQQYFVPVAWRLCCLHDLPVTLKYEFNASNRGIYRADGVLAKGAGSPLKD